MSQFKPFNASAVEPHVDNYDPAPKGEYKMIIEKSEYKPVKSGKGMGLNLEMSIIEGPCKGKKVFEWLNIEHQNETAQQIGQGKLSAYCRAVNVLDLRDPAQLHDLPFIGRLDIEADNKGGERNVVKAVKPLVGKIGNAPVNKELANKFEAPQGLPPSVAGDPLPTDGKNPWD